MVGGHQRQRLRTDQPHAVKFAAVEQGATKGEVVGHGRAQSATAGYERGRRQERALGRIILQRQRSFSIRRVKSHPAFRVGRVAGRQAMGLVGGDKEAGIVHAERLKNAFLQELVEWLAADFSNQVADHIGRDRIIPGFPW